MKRLIVIICLIAFVKTQAQDIKGGLKLSVNSPLFSSDIDNNTKGKIGYSIGYFESMTLTDAIALEGEINYTHTAYESGEGDFQIDGDNNFFELPIMAKYILNDFHIGGGFQYCFGSVTDFGPIIDLTYYNNNLRFGARAFLGSKKNFEGNSMTNLSAYIGFVIF